MIKKLQEIKEKIIETEILIIGAGTNGLYLAERLKKNFKKIILIEKGGINIKKVTKTINKYRGKFHYGFNNNIAIGLGGNSSLWGGQLVEFDKEDFSRNIFWGFNYSEMKKLYNKVYDIFKIKKIKNRDFLNFTKEKNSSYKNIEKFYTHWLSEPNFKNYFLEKKLFDDVDVITNSEVIKTNFNKKFCKNIEISSGKIKKTVKAKIIILSSGTFNVSEFLLKQKSTPWKKNKFIGKYFQDHLGLFIGKIKVIDRKKFNNIFQNGFIKNIKYQPKIKSRYLINNFNYGISGEIKTHIDNKYSDLTKALSKFLHKKNLINLFNLINFAKYLDIFFIKKSIYFFLNKKIIFPDYNKLFFYVQCEQRPNFKSQVFLNNRKKVNLDWNFSGNEFEVIKKFVKDSNNYLKANNIAEIDTKNFEKLNSKNFKKKIRDTNHPSGGTLISRSSQKGVLDKNQKIWNTSNLYVAGPCVLPKTSHANVTFTSLALTERLANYLINKKSK
tara:strand:- start:384 stop:1877 length:1494 start_codon:yes stop_codon:yes gene_type:complete